MLRLQESVVSLQKAALRAWALSMRRGVDRALDALICNGLSEAIGPCAGLVVAGVWPLDDEIDLRPLLDALHGRGARVALPQTPPRGQPLIFRGWQPGAAMLPERFGTCAPAGEIVLPSLILVPLLAFDRRCHRLGYGGGYYDRTLASLPGVPTIGYAYAAQETDALPTEPHDRPLDRIVTERETIALPRAAA